MPATGTTLEIVHPRRAADHSANIEFRQRRRCWRAARHPAPSRICTSGFHGSFRCGRDLPSDGRAQHIQEARSEMAETWTITRISERAS